MQVPEPAVLFHLAQEHCPAVSHLRVKRTELEAGIGHGVAARAAGKEIHALGGAQPVRVKAQLCGELLVEDDHLWVRLLLTLGGANQVGKLLGKIVV